MTQTGFAADAIQEQLYVEPRATLKENLTWQRRDVGKRAAGNSRTLDLASWRHDRAGDLTERLRRQAEAVAGTVIGEPSTGQAAYGLAPLPLNE